MFSIKKKVIVVVILGFVSVFLFFVCFMGSGSIMEELLELKVFEMLELMLMEMDLVVNFVGFGCVVYVEEVLDGVGLI